MTRLEEHRRDQELARRQELRYVLGAVAATGLYFWAIGEASALFFSTFPL